MGKTLCDWSKRDIESRFEELCAITAHPRFLCRKCARSAHDERHLCKPRPRLPLAPPVAAAPADSHSPEK